MDNYCEYANLGRFRKGGLTTLINSIIIRLLNKPIKQMTTATKQTVETLAQEYCVKITEANAEWIKKVRINLDKGEKQPWVFDENGNYKPEENAPYFTYIIGRKYLKVVAMEWKDEAKYGRINAAPAGYQASTVHAFVDKKTGDVFLPASWNAPAKGARFNLFENKEALFEGVMRRPHGGYLYR